MLRSASETKATQLGGETGQSALVFREISTQERLEARKDRIVVVVQGLGVVGVRNHSDGIHKLAESGAIPEEVATTWYTSLAYSRQMLGNRQLHKGDIM